VSETGAVDRATFNDRIFERIRLSPTAFTLLTATLLLGIFFVTVHATGELAKFLASESRWWENRDGRIAVIVALLAGYLPAARRLEDVAVRRHLRQLRDAFAWPPGTYDSLAREIAPTRGSVLVSGVVGFLVLPLIAVSVDRDPLLYFRAIYWEPVHLWTIPISGFVCWQAGVLIASISTHNRAFARLARAAPPPQLLDLDAFAPFTRQALRSVLPVIVALSLLAFNLVDRSFLWAVGLITSAALAWTGGSLYLMLRGVRDRIAVAKHEECQRIDAAIRGDARALADSPIGGRQPAPGLGDLLSWRQFVTSRAEWPLDPALRARALLYVAIPLGSWLGGAVVDHLLDLFLG